MRPYERQEERDFDRWFLAMPDADQQRWRAKGIIPYREMPTSGNVFPVIPNHPAWSSDDATKSPMQLPMPGEGSESISFISESELRTRLVNVFQLLNRFADGRMHLHLIFLRTMLGDDTKTNLAQLCKRFGITKQAMFWRARQLRAALGSVADTRLAWTETRRRSGTVKKHGEALKTLNTHRKGAGRNLLPTPPTKREATRPGVFLRKPSKKRRGLHK